MYSVRVYHSGRFHVHPAVFLYRHIRLKICEGSIADTRSIGYNVETRAISIAQRCYTALRGGSRRGRIVLDEWLWSRVVAPTPSGPGPRVVTGGVQWQRVENKLTQIGDGGRYRVLCVHHYAGAVRHLDRPTEQSVHETKQKRFFFSFFAPRLPRPCPPLSTLSSFSLCFGRGRSRHSVPLT